MIKESKDDKAFRTFLNILLAFCFIIVAYPIIYIVSASFSDSVAVMQGKVWLWPVKPSLDGYRAVFKSHNIVIGYRNSVLYTIGGTLINIFVTILCAYPLARHDLPGRKFLTMLFAFTMIFSGGMMPTYLTVKNLGLLDSFWAVSLPIAMSVWNMIIMRTFFQSNIPESLIDAAHLDGCSDIGILIRIALPLSKAVIAVMVLYYGVAHWNSYFNAMLYFKTSTKYPLPVILRNILVLNQMDSSMVAGTELTALRQGMVELIRYSIIVVASAPLMMLYPFIQKYFVKGVMIGAIKG